MRDFSITEEDIAASRVRWEPEFRAFASRTSQSLATARQLPIHDLATELAREWLSTTFFSGRA